MAAKRYLTGFDCTASTPLSRLYPPSHAAACTPIYRELSDSFAEHRVMPMLREVGSYRSSVIKRRSSESTYEYVRRGR